MIDFKLQRFSPAPVQPETEYGPAWVTDSTANWYFIPSGSTYSAPTESNMGDVSNATIQINCGNGAMIVSGVTGDNKRAEVTMSADNISELTVTGSESGGITFVIDGKNYKVGSGGKLVEAADEPEAGNADEVGEIISTSIVNTTKRADGKTVSKTINFINPKAADSDVATFMAALNSLSKNETIKGGTIIVEKRAL